MWLDLCFNIKKRNLVNKVGPYRNRGRTTAYEKKYMNFIFILS